MAVESSVLGEEFKRLYRANYDWQAMRQIKLEYFECMKTHCYPVSKREQVERIALHDSKSLLCAKHCGRDMEHIQNLALIKE